jgi:hypothetical protein
MNTFEKRIGFHMGVGMNQVVFTYLIYLAVSVTLTVWAARKWRRDGRVFLVDVFRGNEPLADSVSHLLAVGFYLINLGYVSLALKLGYEVADMQGAIEALSRKVGTVLVALGGMHFFNLYVLSRIRRRGALACAPPPLLDGRATVREPDGAGRESFHSVTGEFDLGRFSDQFTAYEGKRR